MINKKVFEDDLIAGMHKELIKNATNQNKDNLGQAVDYLNSAIDIFEDAGMTVQANKVLRILSKIAGYTNVKEMISLHALEEKGVTLNDIKDAMGGNVTARAKVTMVLRELGSSEKDVIEFVGAKNYMDAETAALVLSPDSSLGKFDEWIKNPKLRNDPKNLQPDENFEGKSLLRPQYDSSLPAGSDELVFNSLGFDEQEVKHKHSLKPKSDTHSNGLTSEKMIENLKNHGTVFNMLDDGNAADELLDIDVSDSNVPLEVQEEQETFEETD